MLNSPTHMYRGQNLNQAGGVWRILFTCISSVQESKKRNRKNEYISRMASGLDKANVRVCVFSVVDVDSVKVCLYVTFVLISPFTSNF